MDTVKPQLSSAQIDILKEIGNICVGNSTGILTQLIGGVVDVYLPALDILSIDELPKYIKEKGKMVYGVNAQITTHIQGTIFLLFPEQDSLKIIHKFLQGMDTDGVSTIQFGISIIKEVGGISIFSYLNTLSSLVKKLIMSSVPSFLSGSVDELLQMILREYEHWGNVCIVHNAFKETHANIEGSFYLILNRESAGLILSAVS